MLHCSAWLVSFPPFQVEIYSDLLRVSRPRLIFSRMASRSLSSLSLVTTTLLGWMPTGTLWPLALSRVTRSTWMTYLRR